MTYYYHGGIDGLKPGDILRPGMERKHHDGCAYCEARANGEAHLGIDPLSERHEVYFTPNRLYAKFYASLFGRGDLYRVEPIGPVTKSTEDTMETWTAPEARIVSVYERAVLLTWQERRKLNREWAAADKAAGIEDGRNPFG